MTIAHASENGVEVSVFELVSLLVSLSLSSESGFYFYAKKWATVSGSCRNNFLAMALIVCVRHCVDRLLILLSLEWLLYAILAHGSMWKFRRKI